MKYSLKKAKKGIVVKQSGGGVEEEGEGYPKVQIEELFEPTKELKLVIGAIKDIPHQNFY